MTVTTFRRKKHYLGWKIHGRLVAQIGLLWVAYHVILCVALFALDHLHRVPVYLSAAPLASTSPVNDSFVHHYGWLLMFPAVALPVLLYDTIRVTHRVVGPLTRLENVFQRLTRGEAVTEVHFRDHDLMDGVEEALNAYLATLRATHPCPAQEKESPLDEILGRPGRVVVDDHPRAVDLAEDQRKVAADGAAAVEMPVA